MYITLTFLEIILGIDNIIFISITAGKLPKHKVRKATNIGLFFAMIFRILLLIGVSYIIAMKEPLFTLDLSWFKAGVSGQSLVLLGGGFFLLYKSTHEIHQKVEGTIDETDRSRNLKSSFTAVVIQIVLIDIVFSFDSVLTAVGMTNGISPNPNHALMLMVIAVVVSIIIMIWFANPIRRFIDAHPSMQVLGLAFLILIGFMLIAEAGHASNTIIFDKSIGVIPKGYLYFAISFSLFVEFLNFKIFRRRKLVAVSKDESQTSES